MMFVQIRSLSVWNTGLIQKWKDSNDLPPVQYNHCLFQAKIMKLDLKNDDTHPNHNHIIIKSTPSNFISPTPPKPNVNPKMDHFNLSIFLVDIYIFGWKNGTKVLNQTSQAISLREAWRQGLEADLKEQHPGRSHQAQTGLDALEAPRSWRDDHEQVAGKCSKKQLDMMKWRNMVRMSLWKLKWLNESIDLRKHKFTVSVWWFLPRMSSQSACCMPGLKQPARIAPESCA